MAETNVIMFSEHPDALKLLLLWGKRWMTDNQEEISWEKFPTWLTEQSNIELILSDKKETRFDDPNGPVYWSGMKFPKPEHVTQFLLQYGSTMKDIEL